MNRLITIAFSHYNEKARWALDLAGIAYREEPHFPLFSSLAVARATKLRGGSTDKVSTKFSTPLLILNEGRQIHDSSQICQHAAQVCPSLALYPTPEVTELEQYFHDRVGPNTRRVAYDEVLRDPDMFGRLAENNVSPRQARWARRLFPLIERRLASLGLDADKIEKSRAHVFKEFDAAQDRLGGKSYLVGDRFTAADMSWACMVAPAILVSREEGYGAWLPGIEELSAPTASMVRELRAHPAGQFALRMFREHRRS